MKEHEDMIEISGSIIDIFEDFLESKGIIIENEERDNWYKENLICDKCNSDDCYMVGKTEARCNNCGEHFELDSVPSIIYSYDYDKLEDDIENILKNKLK
ncbi:MAG: hypothetical protein WC781_05660 [Candidatus Pacearchaeota archaeon]|jgi:hypothetical protein